MFNKSPLSNQTAVAIMATGTAMIAVLYVLLALALTQFAGRCGAACQMLVLPVW